MTTEQKIDHAAAARAALDAASATPAEGVLTDPWLLSAQVHATLALVEQQRIASLVEEQIGVPTVIGAVEAASVPRTRPAPSATTTASPPTTRRPW